MISLQGDLFHKSVLVKKTVPEYPGRFLYLTTACYIAEFNQTVCFELFYFDCRFH